MNQTGSAEIGYHEDDGEVFLKYAGKKSYMQPDEARQMANLLMQSAEAAETNPQAGRSTYVCEDCGDEVTEPEASGEWECVLCGGRMRNVADTNQNRTEENDAS